MTTNTREVKYERHAMKLNREAAATKKCSYFTQSFVRDSCNFQPWYGGVRRVGATVAVYCFLQGLTYLIHSPPRTASKSLL